MKTLFLVRHGKTTGAGSVFCGSTDVPLSAEGIKQSRNCADYLLQHKVSLVVTTGRQRTDQLGELLAARGVRHMVEPDLREVDFGQWEQQSWSAIQTAYPHEAKSWLDKPADMHFPGGEAMAAFRERVLAAWQRLAEQPEKTIAIILHSGTSAQLLQHLTHVREPQYLEPAQIMRLTLDGEFAQSAKV